MVIYESFFMFIKVMIITAALQALIKWNKEIIVLNNLFMVIKKDIILPLSFIEGGKRKYVH